MLKSFRSTVAGLFLSSLVLLGATTVAQALSAKNSERMDSCLEAAVYLGLGASPDARGVEEARKLSRRAAEFMLRYSALEAMEKGLGKKEALEITGSWIEFFVSAKVLIIEAELDDEPQVFAGKLTESAAHWAENCVNDEVQFDAIDLNRSTAWMDATGMLE